MTGKPFDPGQPVAIFSSRNAIGRGSNLSELAFLMHGAHGRMELVDPNHDPDGQFARALGNGDDIDRFMRNGRKDTSPSHR